MKSIGFLGCGKIGRQLLALAEQRPDCRISFVQDPFFIPNKQQGFPVLEQADEDMLAQTDLVVECATADILKANGPAILRHCDLLPFSLTAFADQAFAEATVGYQQQGRRIFIPHGAILGLEGIADGAALLEAVSIETVKNPRSLGREDSQRVTVFAGSTREACLAFPRNVNVHAAVALAGLGFDRTCSRIISDPEVGENSHLIQVQGQGFAFSISVSSAADSGVTGLYTPLSAQGSLLRVLDGGNGLRFV